jgi:hypothetical protein
MNSPTPVERKLSYDERANYGECPVCHAKHGERCKDERQGPQHGVHLGRLQNAPMVIREIPIR